MFTSTNFWNWPSIIRPISWFIDRHNTTIEWCLLYCPIWITYNIRDYFPHAPIIEYTFPCSFRILWFLFMYMSICKIKSVWLFFLPKRKKKRQKKGVIIQFWVVTSINSTHPNNYYYLHVNWYINSLLWRTLSYGHNLYLKILKV